MNENQSIPTTREELNSSLQNTTTRDRSRLHRLWSNIEQRRSQEQPVDKLINRFCSMHAKALALYSKRQQMVPQEILFPEQLPVCQRVDEIAEAIKDNQVVILAGETGSGKTTQLPKICLKIGRGLEGTIGHTQPRRIAANSVANRIAEELNTTLGTCVGYQVRFTDQSQEDSLIKLMTDGILLAEIQNDPLLLRYDTLIVDEAHERSLNIDFLLGYIKKILPKRPDLRVIVTSATIDVERFSRHFNHAPIVEVSGRTYPVDIIYRPWAGELEDQAQAILETVEDILSAAKGPQGDILVFLSGEREIRETAQLLRRAQLPHLDVLPLYARLSMAEQKRVFQSHKGRRIVLATNVAETSITVPGIGYVIDPGTARISRYSVRTKVQRLPIEAVSQASANQRAGRCGRVSHGICYRLYSEEDFLSRSEFTDPEIKRTNLASVVLQMLHLGIGEIRRFPFVDPPDKKFINDGYKLLEELKAVDQKGKLTALGKQLAGMPLDPRLARMLLEANRNGALKELLIITSALTIQDPRERPAEKQQAADEKHRRFWHEESDFLAYLNLWQYVEEQRQALSQNQWRKQCGREFLSFMRLREWRELHHQLRVSCKQQGWRENAEPASNEAVHQSLLAGLLSYIGFRNEESSDTPYLGPRNSHFALFPGSSLYKKRPKWMMAAELIETSKLFAHCVAKVDPAWILKLSEHLQKHHYYEPHYVAKSGQVMGYDRVTLYGLTLVEKRPVNYGHIDPTLAREVFIRSALVEGRYEKNPKAKGKFFQHNREIIESVELLEAKSRRKDILVDDEVVYRFYDERIGKDITNLASFEHWRKQAEHEQAGLLHIPKDLLMQHTAAHISEAQFPNTLLIEGMELPLSYHFEPGHPDDGVSVGVPAGVLHAIPPHRLDWLVPGFLRDKCIAMLKSLPKQWRKLFVPVPHYVDQILPRLTPSNTPLVEALTLELQRLLGRPLPENLWDSVVVDDFYRMNIQVMDERNRVIDRGRNLLALREQYREHVQTTLQNAGEELERTKLSQWDFGELPESCQLDQNGIKVKAFPALVREKEGIALRMLDNPVDARVATQWGVVGLIQQQLGPTIKYLQKNLLKNKDIGLTLVNMGRRETVIGDLISAAIWEAAELELALPRDQTAFATCLKNAQEAIVPLAQNFEGILLESLKQVVELRKLQKKHRNNLAMVFAVADTQEQLDNLLYEGCLSETHQTWFKQFPRYVNGMIIRLEKAALDPRKDKQQLALVSEYWQKHKDRLATEGKNAFETNEQWQHFRWMIEEYRISLFAQTLKTLMPVSDKRLDKAWQASLK